MPNSPDCNSSEGPASAQPQTKALHGEVRELRRLLEQESSARRELLSSSSWKFTAPLRALKTFLVRDRARNNAASAQGEPSLAPAQLANIPAEPPERNGNETFRLLDGSEALRPVLEASRRAAIDGRRIAFIGSRELADDLMPDARVEVLGERTWRAQLEGDFDYVLLETVWNGALNDWRYAMVKEAEEDEELSLLLDHCRQSGIPTVLWFREDPRNYARFAWLTQRVDRVYAVDNSIHSLVAADAPAVPLAILPPAVQPATHNPLKSYALKEVQDQFRDLVLFDGWWELVGNRQVRDAVEKYRDAGLRVCESDWEFGRVRLGELAELAPYVLGCVDSTTKAVLNKLIGAELFFESNLRLPWRQRQEMLRAAACGCLVGAIEPVTDLPVPAWSGDQSDVLPWLRSLKERRLAAERRAHVIKREILKSDCMAHRLHRISTDLGLSDSSRTKDPSVSVILVTMRPQLLPAALERFRNDVYPEKELTVVLHGEHDAGAARKLVMPGEPITIRQLGRERGLGACLNQAIDQSNGEYWAKVDDDDLYGSNYLTDLMLNRSTIDFDLAGKPPVFAYLESSDSLYHDPVWEEHSHLWHDPGEAESALVAGGTLTGKRALLDRVRFCEKRRGGSDSDFIRRCYEHGIGVLAADGFNFVRYRSAAEGFHTWQMDERDLLDRGSRIGGRQDVEKEVFI